MKNRSTNKKMQNGFYSFDAKTESAGHFIDSRKDRLVLFNFAVTKTSEIQLRFSVWL